MSHPVAARLALQGFVNRRQEVIAADPAGKKAEIASGKFDIFAGPITDQAGAVKVPAGKSMDFGEQMSIQWFVKGVDGEIPAK